MQCDSRRSQEDLPLTVRESKVSGEETIVIKNAKEAFEDALFSSRIEENR